MDKKKLPKLRRQLAKLRNQPNNITSGQLMRLAEQLGRERSRQRTNEPTFISQSLPHSRPISIPDHAGNLKRFTAGNILDALERDIFALEEEIEKGDET